MPANPQLTFLLASASPALVGLIEPALAASGARVEVALSGKGALEAMTGTPSPSLALLDVDLPGMDMGQLLAAVGAAFEVRRFPIVLISDTVTQESLDESLDRLALGVIDDLILPADAPWPYWKLRLDLALSAFRRARELDQLRDTASSSPQTDPLTGLYNRSTLLSMLFRETDRAQRLKSSLSLILFDIDDFGHWNTRLGASPCDEILVQAVGRVQRLLRSYDIFGRIGEDEFLLALPGCSRVNAVMLAERVRGEVFSAPFHVAAASVRLSACFGIAASQGRSPVVVLRDAERALQAARASGPETIECAIDSPPQQEPLVAVPDAPSSDEPLAW